MFLRRKILRISLVLYSLTFLQVFGLSESLPSPSPLLLKSGNQNKLHKIEPTVENRHELWKRAADENSGPKIFGGLDANQTAYMLSLQLPSGAHQCGGVILSPRFALSAAHCFDDISSPAVWRVVAGELNLTVDEETEQVRRIKRIHIHPDYSGTPLWQNDIALIELVEPLNFKAGVVGSVEWKDDNKNLDCFNGEVATAFGWGETETGNLSDVLRLVYLPIVTNNACQKQYRKAKNPKIITDAMLCAGQRGSGRDTCKGDSGGPLILDTLLVGITSYGEGCGGNYAGVYTRVSAFTTWIESKINPKISVVWTTPSTTTISPARSPPPLNHTIKTKWDRNWSAILFNQPDYGGKKISLSGNACINVQELAQPAAGGSMQNSQFVPPFRNPPRTRFPFPTSFPQTAPQTSGTQKQFQRTGLPTKTNQVQFLVKSVNHGATCVRLFTGRGCIGNNVIYEPGSRCSSNISECGHRGPVRSIGPC